MNIERNLLERINAFVLDKHLTISDVAYFFEMETEINETFLEVEELLAQPEPFKPDWDNYKQGVADSKREPLSDEEVRAKYRDIALDNPLYVPSYYAGFRDAEKAHGIGGGE